MIEFIIGFCSGLVVMPLLNYLLDKVFEEYYYKRLYSKYNAYD